MEPKLIIDPNINKAYLKINGKIKSYDIATADINGDNHEHAYYTPVGLTKIIEKKKVTNIFFPAFIRLNFLKLPFVNLQDGKRPYFLHGPYGIEAKMLEKNGRFKNNGYLSKGCVRFKENDILELYENLNIGDIVKIIEYNDKDINNFIKKHSKN